MKRSYCGCSVRVVVTFSTDVRLMDLDDILVYTRFEPTRVVPLWPESLVSLAQDLGAPGFDDTQENRRLEIGESVANIPWQSGRPGDGWVRGERVSHQHLSNNKALYVLNGGKSPKWFYHYDSSITRTQREMTHHLVAYIFRLEDNQSTTVVARHASPAFVLMSYRRSHGSDGSLSAKERPQNNLKQKCPYATKKPSDAVDQQKSQTVGTCEAQEDSSLWQLDAEHYFPGFREKGLHTLILLEFLQRLTLEDIHVDTRLPINHWLHVFSALQSPLSPQSGGIVESFLSEIFRDTGREEVSTIQMTLYLLIRALSSSTVRHLIQSALEVDSKELHDSFTRLISCSYDFLNGLVQDTSNATISTLVDDVLSIVYSQGRFNVLRGQLSNLLLGQQAPGPLSNALNRGLCTFKTLMLQCGQQPHSRAPVTPKTTLQSAWSRRWLLEPGSLKLSDGVRGIIPALRVVNVALFFRECGSSETQVLCVC
ncbi:hypothetical protein DVH05_003214 [Phytophthora capsici]|nr:hypothetical protein DVH05_003214 [Phytophthora capsici]